MMTIRNHTSMMHDSFDEYLSFRRGDTAYKASKYLSAVFNVVSKEQTNDNKRWLERIAEEEFSTSEVESIIDGINREKLTLLRLLSAFDNWIFEDMVYLMTIRIEIEMVMDWLASRTQIAHVFEFSSIDRKIRLLAAGSRTKGVYDFACEAIEKNWGLPISSSFFKLNTRSKEAV